MDEQGLTSWCCSSSEPYTLYRGQYVDSVSTLLWTADMEPEVGAPAISISAGLTTELPDTGTHLPVGLQLQARPGDVGDRLA